jgi:hypothetical protein
MMKNLMIGLVTVAVIGGVAPKSMKLLEPS